jgi:DNA primase
MNKKLFELVSNYLTLKKAGKEYITHCIFHSERRPSLSLNFDLGVYYCFGCKAKGTILSLLEKLTGKKFKDIFIEEFLRNKTNKKEEKQKQIFDINIFPPLTEDLKVYKSFLERRGITFDLVKIFDIRKGINEWSGRLIFPVYINKECVGFVSRAVYSGAPKWKHPSGFSVSNYLYGYDFINDEEVVLVEGVFDVISLRKHKIQAVALFGKNLTDNQLYLLLEKNIKKVYLCLDGDVKDEELKKIYNKLKGWVLVEVLKLPCNKDPDDLGKEIFNYKVNLSLYWKKVIM